MFNIVNDKQTTDELNTSKFFIMMEPFRQCIVALIAQYTKFILKFILVFLGLSASNIHGTKEVHLSEDLTWAVHCDYIMKKVNRRLYTLRQLKKRKVPSADIVHIYCALIRTILEYASAVFADSPKYLACYLENVQKGPFPSYGLVFRMKQHLKKLDYPLFLTVGQSRVLNL